MEPNTSATSPKQGPSTGQTQQETVIIIQQTSRNLEDTDGVHAAEPDESISIDCENVATLTSTDIPNTCLSSSHSILEGAAILFDTIQQDADPLPSQSNAEQTIVFESAVDNDMYFYLISIGIENDEARKIVEEQKQIREDEEMAMRLIHVDPISETEDDTPLIASMASGYGSTGESNATQQLFSSSISAQTAEDYIPSKTDMKGKVRNCMICFEKVTVLRMEPCGHGNICVSCLSKLVKPECPTCRIPVTNVMIQDESRDRRKVIALKSLIDKRKEAENRAWDNTLQIVFIGPQPSCKEKLLSKMFEYYNTEYAKNTASGMPEEAASSGEESSISASLAQIAAFPELRRVRELLGLSSKDAELLLLEQNDLEFVPNAWIKGIPVRVASFQRNTLTSKRMVIEDLRVLRPDLVVICVSMKPGMKESELVEELQSWDRIIRQNTSLLRIWLVDCDAAAGTDPSCSSSEQGIPSYLVSLPGFSVDSYMEACRKSTLILEPSSRPRHVIFTVSSRDQQGQESGDPWELGLLGVMANNAQVSRATRTCLLPANVTVSSVPGTSASSVLMGASPADAVLASASASLGNMMSSLSGMMWTTSNGFDAPTTHALASPMAARSQQEGLNSTGRNLTRQASTNQQLNQSPDQVSTRPSSTQLPVAASHAQSPSHTEGTIEHLITSFANWWSS